MYLVVLSLDDDLDEVLEDLTRVDRVSRGLTPKIASRSIIYLFVYSFHCVEKQFALNKREVSDMHFVNISNQ